MLVHRLARASAQLLEANLQTLEALGIAIAKRDSDTESHSYRVTLISVRMAEALGWSESAIRELIKGARAPSLAVSLTSNESSPGAMLDSTVPDPEPHKTKLLLCDP